MKRLGLDFGTTNSTLCYFDPVGKALKCFQMQGASDSSYIPSCVRYEKEDGSVEIGRTAKTSIGDEDYEVFSGFKMLLAEKENPKLEEFGFISKSPYECAKDYFNNLIRIYYQEQQVDKIDQLVITVPQIWVAENRHESREALNRICQDLELESTRFLSEPVAASAFFSYCFRQKHQKPFNGHILVCDYGGGTLDLSLSEAQGDRITVLESTGRGNAKDTLGEAGVAYDEAVVKRVYEAQKGEKISKGSDPALFYKLVQGFEALKIDRKKDVDKKLEQYLKQKNVDKSVFDLDGLKFRASDFAETFDEVIRDALIQSLEEMQEYFHHHGVDPGDRDRFRVVMAGGFSGFFLVRETVRSFFGSRTGTDQRFDSCFSVVDSALAISMGAALVANEMINIDPTCPISVGIRIKTDVEGYWDDVDIPVLKKGVKLSEYNHPVFFPEGLSVEVDPAMRTTPITLFMGDGGKRRYIRVNKDIDRLLPNIRKPNNRWQIGFSVDENYLFTFHAVDSEENRKDTSLGDLLSKYSGIYLAKEEK